MRLRTQEYRSHLYDSDIGIGGCIDEYIDVIELTKPALRLSRGGDRDGI